jgi:hypothetical protein
MTKAPKRIVLWDVDHVMADSGWRDSMIGGEGGWDAYHLAGKDDAPVEVVVDMIRAFRAYGFENVGLTARPEKWRGLSMEWFVRCGVPLDDVMMRPTNNFDPSPKVKLDLVRARWPDYRERIAFLVEDRDDVCAVFRAEGVVCLQCHVYAVHAPSVPLRLENEEGVAR